MEKTTAHMGVGRVKLAPYASGASLGVRKYWDTGNNSAFNLSFTENVNTLRDFTDEAGGTDAEVRRIDAASGQIDFRHISLKNLAALFWGSSGINNTTAITGEAIKAHFGAFVPTKRVINRTVAPVLKKGATTLDTADYTVSDAGITFKDEVATSGLVDGDDITIDYTPRASYNVQALVAAAPLLSVIFEGKNVRNGEPFVARIYRVRLGVASNVSLIGEEFATFSVTYTIEKDNDDTTIAANDSRWFQLEIGQAAA